MAASVTAGQFAELGNGIRLHYASAGVPGRPLMLFLHGFPEAWFEWQDQLEEFGTDHFAVAPDLRGFNLSSQPVGVENYRARLILDDLRRFIGLLGYEHAIVVAHDWGGAVAWNLAIFLPQLVERLLIINSPHPYQFMRALAGDPAQQAASQYMNWLRKPGSEGALLEHDCQLLDGMFIGNGQADSQWYTPAVRERYHTMWRQNASGSAVAMQGAVNYYRSSPARPPLEGETITFDGKPGDWTLRVPVRVIWGEADIALLPVLLEDLELVCPDLHVTRIAQGTHWIIHQMPARVNALLRGYLSN